jgi:hypothetical protein
MTLEVLDPRHDPEPPYWRELRVRGGLRADWAWSVLAAQAWGSRTRMLVTVLHGTGGPYGVISSAWIGLPVRRTSFAPLRGGPLVGGLHVRSPGTSALPGWWLADGTDIGELTGRYGPGMRRALGLRCLGLLLRQVGETDAAALGTRLRLVRPTEPLWRLRTSRWRDREDWLRDLSTKRRSNLRRVFGRFEQQGRVHVAVGRATDADPAAVADLLRHNDRKYTGRWLSPPPQLTGYLAELLSQPDVLSLTYTDSETGRLLGFGSVLDHPEWPVWRHWSMLPLEAGGAKHLYFNHIGQLVDWAIAEGKQGVVLGKGKSSEKGSIGAEEVKQLAVVAPAW